jgi:hypothetical protein
MNDLKSEIENENSNSIGTILDHQKGESAVIKYYEFIISVVQKWEKFIQSLYLEKTKLDDDIFLTSGFEMEEIIKYFEGSE